MRSLSKREKMIVTAGLIFSLAYGLMQYLLLPYWDNLNGYSAKIGILSKRLVSYRKILLGQDSVKAALEEAKRRQSAAETGLLVSGSEALAGAEIQGAS